MTHYLIRVRGQLSPETCATFPTLALRRRGAHSVLSGDLPDQCALLGALEHLDLLGIEILGVTRTERDPASAG
ncbi:MAG: hypothetical protein ACTHOK_01630 [Nocardioidaceae bacterium]